MYSDRILTGEEREPAAQPVPIEASLGFVSRRHLFSDCLCRATEAELPGVHVTKFDDVHEVMAAGPQWRDYLRLIVLDESAAEALDVVQARWLTRNIGTQFACAFSNAGRAARLMENSAYPDPLGSLFPLNMGIDGWISVLKLCLTGHHYVSPDLMSRPASAPLDTPDEVDRLACLTPREREVLELVAGGCQNKEIAARLELSENTVKLHLRNIISKLGVHNRTEAAMIHVQHRRH
ncbi:response regulator transcription factor [Roseovarius sp. MMSF_3281]|uniref:helix-turn-helix transcriptional regulator n=1 Tax=Roseovarius sp. MMSF_3281 TaxID=3046694 RepID=UPI00273FFBA0|nr:response regulator transcription factor [Roseovarius sp. MMSF_3281]